MRCFISASNMLPHLLLNPKTLNPPNPAYLDAVLHLRLKHVAPPPVERLFDVHPRHDVGVGLADHEVVAVEHLGQRLHHHGTSVCVHTMQGSGANTYTSNTTPCPRVPGWVLGDSLVVQGRWYRRI